MMIMNQQTTTVASAGTIGTTGVLAIFGNYSTEWTLLLTAIATSVLVANFVVNKRRVDRDEGRKSRQEARDIAEFNRRNSEGTDNGQTPDTP